MDKLVPGGQVDPFLRKRKQANGGIEFTLKPVAGTLVAAGYRGDYVTRDLRFASPPEAITPGVNLQNADSVTHAVYLRARTRLLRGLQLSGELGYERSPEVSFPRDSASSCFDGASIRCLYFEGRGSYTLAAPVPVTLSASGYVRHGENDEIFLQDVSDPGMPGNGEPKDFKRSEWSYNVNATVVPCQDVSFCDSLVLYTSFIQDRDSQFFEHVRSDLPRYFAPAGGFLTVDFFIDSPIDYESDLKTLILGGTYQIVPEVSVSLAPTLTWLRADFGGSDTADILDDVNQIDSRIFSIESTVGYEPIAGLYFEVGHRYDDYRDERDLAALRLDSHVHTLSFSARFDFALLKHIPKQAGSKAATP